MERIFVEITGEPAPQGSKKIIQGRLVEASKKLKPWRKAVAEACKATGNQNLLLGPIEVQVIFFLTRPPSVKQSKRALPIVPPDTDKLARALLDGIGDSGVIWGDDSQVVRLIASKEYADNRKAGAEVTIRAI